ncbi:MAG: type IV secretory system conjugative DNA transfer family protein [Lachnospiraceae bacterium]|nr:type IV secretory system conjugative DNA transfer family protein [Lachnospiraceae bacterium]
MKGVVTIIHNIKQKIRDKLNDTVFGEAKSILNRLYKKNSGLLAFEIAITYLISILITGFLCLCTMNLSGAGYKINLVNIILAWLQRGIFISLICDIFVQLIVIKILRIFDTGYKRDEERNYDISTEGTYGTNDFMSEEEMKKTFVMEKIENNKATIFGRDPRNRNTLVGQKHPLMKLNRNVLMVAGPSGGKSATFVIPLIMQIMRRGESAIISDPKSELFKYLSELAKMLGYEVRILNLNPMFLDNSDPCNFMAYVRDDVDKAQVMSSAIISNTTGGDAMFDFWTEGASNLLQAIILRISVGNDYMEEEKNLPMLFTYLVDKTAEEIEADFSTLPKTHPATAPFLIWKDGDAKPKMQVLQGLRIKLKLFNSKKLRKILSETKGGIDILNPGRKKCLYFVGSNDQDSSMAPILSLFYTLLYQELVRYADMRQDGQLPKAVHMVLDEYANMGTIPDFEKKLSTVRSRNIITYIIIQDINQLKTKHPNDTWKTVKNDCDYYILLKTNDEDTMQWWSTLSGEQTIAVKNSRYSRSKSEVVGIHNFETVTEGSGTRQVVTLGEARKIKDDELMLYVSQRDMVKLKTFYWKDHPYGQFLEKHADSMYILPAQHYPFWKLIEDGIVDENFDYDNEPSYIMELKEDEKIEDDSDYDPDSILKLKKQESKVNVITKLFTHKVKKGWNTKKLSQYMKDSIKEGIAQSNDKDNSQNDNKQSVHQVRMVKQQESKQDTKEKERSQPIQQPKRQQSKKQIASDNKESSVARPNVAKDNPSEKKTLRSPSHEEEKMASMIQQVEKEVKNIKKINANKGVPLSFIMDDVMEEEKKSEQVLSKKKEDEKKDSIQETVQRENEENAQDTFSFFEDMEDLGDW